MDRVESLACCIHPGILAYFQSEEGQKEFAEWKKTEAGREDPEPQYIEGEPTLCRLSFFHVDAGNPHFASATKNFYKRNPIIVSAFE